MVEYFTQTYTIRLIFYFILFSNTQVVFGQSDMIRQRHHEITRRGMLTLGGWATANLAVSPILASNSHGSTRYFHQMNAYWNVVNLGLAGLGLLNNKNLETREMNQVELLNRIHATEKILLFNAGLDMAYVMAGWALTERGKQKTSNQMKGFGQSLVMQGGFLFLFDLAFYSVHHRNSKQIMQYIGHVSFNQKALSLTLNF